MTPPVAPPAFTAQPAETAADVARPGVRRVRILFHINDFGRGGTETALLAWLNALDRSAFEVGLSVTYPTADLTMWRAKAIPADVALQVLASERWMHALHQRERVRRLRGGEKLLHKASTHALIRPAVARRFLRLARGYDVVCDFDFSLRRIAGRGGMPWIGVSHYSFAARFGEKSAAYMARRVRQYERYTALAVLTPVMRREAESLFADTRVVVTALPNVIDPQALRARADEPAELPAGRFIVSSRGSMKGRRIIGPCCARMRKCVQAAPTRRASCCWATARIAARSSNSRRSWGCATRCCSRAFARIRFRTCVRPTC